MTQLPFVVVFACADTAPGCAAEVAFVVVDVDAATAPAALVVVVRECFVVAVVAVVAVFVVAAMQPVSASMLPTLRAPARRRARRAG